MREIRAFLLAVGTTLTLSGLAMAQVDLQTFLRADANADGEVNVSDAVSTFEWLFAGQRAPPCLDAADSNDDGKANIADGIFTLCFLFSGGEPIPPPGAEECGRDPTADALDCERFSPCRQICGGIAGFPCEPGQFCDLPADTCDGADFLGECVDIPDACLEIFDPVCGCDGVTYSNDCVRIRAGAQKERDGPCGTVCGGIAGIPCEPGQFCDLPADTCDGADFQGECVNIPAGCPRNFNPVCGCDGVTYSNDCVRIMAGVTKDRDGPCRAVCGGFPGFPCREGEICDLPPGQCGAADLQGECVDRPEVCLAIFDPVCGCDGVTYSNDCVRLAAGTQKNHDGRCED